MDTLTTVQYPLTTVQLYTGTKVDMPKWMDTLATVQLYTATKVHMPKWMDTSTSLFHLFK